MPSTTTATTAANNTNSNNNTNTNAAAVTIGGVNNESKELPLATAQDIAYYEKLRRDLRDTLQKKQDIEKNLVRKIKTAIFVFNICFFPCLLLWAAAKLGTDK
jgi:predicted phage-related endonuclease